MEMEMEIQLAIRDTTGRSRNPDANALSARQEEIVVGLW